MAFRGQTERSDPSRGDGVPSVIKGRRMIVRYERAQYSAKPGGTAGSIIIPVPAKTLGQGFLYALPATKEKQKGASP